MGLQVVRTLPDEAWSRFVDGHPQGNVFHTPEMFQVFARTRGYQPTLWAAVDCHDCPLALFLPVRITLMGGPLRRLTTRAVAYGSALCVLDAEGQEALRRLLQAYRENSEPAPLFTELRNLSNTEVIQPILQEQGFVYEDHLNYLINLGRSPDAIMRSIGSRTRKNIRRGLRRGKVVIEEATSNEQVAECYDVLLQTYRAAQVPLADRSLFEAAFDLLYPRGMVRFSLARVAHTPVAASVELLHKDVIHGWYGGMVRHYSSYLPSELLMWHILQWGATNGYRLYDFGGAGRPGEEYGVRHFKAKFGGQLVCYGRNTCVHAPMALRVSRSGYRIFRQILPYIKPGAGESAFRGLGAD